MSKIIKATHLVFSFPRIVALPQKQEELKEEDLTASSEDIIAEAEHTVEELFLEAKKKTEAMIAQSQQEAKSIIDKAHIEAEEACKQARQEGFEAGYQEIRKDLAGEWKRLETASEEMKREFQEERQRWFSELEPKIIKLAVSIARKLIHAELSLDPGKIEAIAGAVLERVVAQEEVTVNVCADDYPYLENLTQESFSRRKIKVVIDNTLDRGDCCLSSSGGMLNGSMDKQLEAVSSGLLEVTGDG